MSIESIIQNFINDRDVSNIIKDMSKVIPFQKLIKKCNNIFNKQSNLVNTMYEITLEISSFIMPIDRNNNDFIKMGRAIRHSITDKKLKKLNKEATIYTNELRWQRKEAIDKFLKNNDVSEIIEKMSYSIITDLPRIRTRYKYV